MQIIKIKMADIVPYENNVKLHPKEQIEQIKKSIVDFGNNDPIAVDENNVIIEGHGRYEALKELGYEEIDGKPYEEIVKIAREYVEEKGGFEKLAEWGLF